MPLASCHVPMTVEVLTTKDVAEKYVLLLYNFLGNNVDGRCDLKLVMKCTENNDWACLLFHNDAVAPLVRYLHNITDSQVKLWKFTKTSATNMRVVCNDVVVTNFNFETNSFNDYQKTKDILSGQPISVIIGSRLPGFAFVKDF